MNNHTELENLTQGYIDGALSDVEGARLNELLADSKDARRVFAESLNIDSAIAATAAGWQV